MGLFNIFSDNKRKWFNIMANGDVEKDFKLIIEKFFIQDDIDLDKYMENNSVNNIIDEYGGLASFEDLKSISSDPELRNFVINCTPTFKEHFANNRFNRGLQVPDWFYIGYPDVALWMKKNDEIIDKNIEGKEDEFFSDKAIKVDFFRLLINLYKRETGKNLECTNSNN
jgi:hypothetical protein